MAKEKESEKVFTQNWKIIENQHWTFNRRSSVPVLCSQLCLSTENTVNPSGIYTQRTVKKNICTAQEDDRATYIYKYIGKDDTQGRYLYVPRIL